MSATTVSPDAAMSSSSTDALVLDFGTDAIRLMSQAEDGTVSELGHAALDAPDFAAKVEALRIEHLVQGDLARAVFLRLPPEQIVTRRFEIAGRGPTAHRVAAEKLGADLGYAADDLVVAVTDRWPDGTAAVVGALRQTAQEASEYAERWGFEPGPLISPVSSGAGVTLILRNPSRVPAQTQRIGTRLITGAVAAAVLGAVSLGAMTLGPSLIDQMSPPTPKLGIMALAPTEVRNDGQVSLIHSAALGPLRVSALGRDALLDPRMPQIGLMPAVSTVEPIAVDGLLQELTSPALGTTLTVGAAPSQVELDRPGRLEPPAATPGLRGVGTAYGTSRTTMPSALPAAETLTPDPSDEPIELASATISAIAVSTDAQAPLVPVDLETDETPTGFAPTEMAAAPLPRPALVDATPAPEEALSKEEPTEEELKAAAAEDVATLEQPSASLIALAPAAAEETPSKLAVSEAPPPAARPQRLAARYLAEAQSRAHIQSTRRLRQSGPRTIQQAADRNGLALDRTSLLGVMQAQDGRQALVRTQDGDFRKVSRGDVIDGWRVASIGRTAMRLTRQGQNKTLLMVGR